MTPMSLRHALLGLLIETPASGYELTRTFEQTLDQFAWQARHSQIYPELNRLTRDGLIEVVAEGARGRKTYATTEAGRAEFTEWMMRPPEGGVRNEFILRLFLVSSLEHDRAVELLRRYADDSHTQLGAIGKYLQEHELDLESDQLDYGHLAADYGLRLLKATNEWAEAALARINRNSGAS